MANGSTKQSKQALASERRLEVLELKKKGHSFSEIANALSISKTQAFKDYKRSLEELLKEEVSNMDALRAMELQRLDYAMQKLMKTLDTVDPDENSFVAAANAYVRLSESRRKLLGIDAPEKKELSGDLKTTAPAITVLLNGVQDDVFNTEENNTEEDKSEE